MTKMQFPDIFRDPPKQNITFFYLNLLLEGKKDPNITSVEESLLNCKKFLGFTRIKQTLCS